MHQFGLSILLWLALLGAGCGQDEKNGGLTGDKTHQKIKSSADSMMAAFKNKDWNTFARFNHQAMINMLGGKAKYIEFVQQQMQQLADTSIKKLEAGKVLQVVKTATDLQCLVEQQMIMHVEGMKITATTYLVGESLNGGNSWTFFDASNGGLVTAKDIKPNISPELTIPAKKQKMQKL